MKYDLQLNVISFRLIIWIIGLAALYGCCDRINVSSKSAHTSTEHTDGRNGRELINAINYIKSDEWDSFIKNIIVINIV